jgi:hypothetical protein
VSRKLGEVQNAHGLIVLHDYYPELRDVRIKGNVVTGPWYAVERLKTEVNGLTVFPFSEAGDVLPELSTSTMALLSGFAS